MKTARGRETTTANSPPFRAATSNGPAPALATTQPLDRPATLWQRYGPYLIALVYLALGYAHYAPGAQYSLSPEHYRAWSFPAFRYSDLIWLYLRDGLDQRPLPYVDYPLEYPPLTGLISWLLRWSSDLPAYFALAYALLAASALLAIWALQHIDGASVWLFAAAPALFFYTGHQWDMAAVAAAALSLFAFQRGRDGWGIAGLVAATSLKLFPVVFVAAAVVERVRDRRYRSAAAIAAMFGAGTAIINLPVALASYEGWSFFFRWNRDRLADSGIWVLWRDVPTTDLTRWSLIAAVAGGAALTILAFRTRGPLLIPLGATYLLWWLLVNKTFTTHLMLWVFLCLALLSAPWWLWAIATAADLAGFQLGNFLNLYNIPDYRHAPLIRKAVENMYDPMQIARTGVLLLCSLWGMHVLRGERLRARYATLSTFRLDTWSPSAMWGGMRWKIPSTANLARAIPLAAGITLIFILATLAMTWPYARNLGDVTIVGFDPYLQIWLSEWSQHALLTNPFHLYDANIFYPFPQTLAYTDANIPGALLAAPLRLLTGDPILTNSLLVLASFVLAGTGVYALITYLTGNRGAALVAGLAYAFLPYRMVHLWHLNWLEGAWLPWLMLALLRLVDRPSLARGVTLGLLAAVLILTSFYFSVQIALIGIAVVVARSIATRRLPATELTRGLAVAVVVAAVLTVPLYLPYLQVHEEQGLERSILDAEQYKALPSSYLQLAPWHAPNVVQRPLGVRPGANESLTEVGQAQHADGHQHAEIVIEDALYPGAIAAIFAIVGIAAWRDRRWLAIAFAVIGAIALLLSLGPTLGPRHGSGPPLPYGWLFEHAPFFRAMRVPARLGGLADFMIVLLAGLGLAAAWNRLRTHVQSFQLAKHAWVGSALTIVLAAAVLADLWAGFIPLEAVSRTPEAGAAARWLATQPPGAVMEFPAESVFADPAAASVRRHYGESMFWSTLHWKPLVNGNSGFIPRAYSDFIERFVGDLQRPDGSTTARISHVDAGTVRLLQQIGVRYLVFHRAHYRGEDWPAVASQLDALAESGVLTPAGEHGDAAIYLLNPTAPGIAPPRLNLFAPTLIAPSSAWGPWVGVESESGVPSVLALTRPAMLETIWYSDAGKRLWSGKQRIPLPVVLEDPRLLCGPASCLTSRSFDDLSRLPPPEGDGSWQPDETGHYVVQLRLTGENSLDCRMDLDVVPADELRTRQGNHDYRWAECAPNHDNPVNDPGALPFDLSPPSVTLIGNTATVDITVTPKFDEEVRGWFILAPPGTPEPWRDAVFKSPVQQQLVLAREPASFEWQTAIGPHVPPGVYGLTVWFHHRGPSGWEHAEGGDVGIAPIVVAQDGALRWAGPVRVRLTRLPGPLPVGQPVTLDLAVDGTSNTVRCVATWRLQDGAETVASGNAGSCEQPEIIVPTTLAPGPYLLELDAYVERDDQRHLSDGVAVPVTATHSTADPGLANRRPR